VLFAMLETDDVFAMRIIYSGVYLAAHEKMRMKEADNRSYFFATVSNENAPQIITINLA
jgi:hypothetical protein